MLVVVSALRGYAIEASDGLIGEARDALFDDRSWRIRWVTVETGSWLTGRKVLIHPSSITRVDHAGRVLRLAVTKAQVEGSPTIASDEPVSEQMEHGLCDYYGWDPHGGGGGYPAGAMSYPVMAPPSFNTAREDGRPDMRLPREDGDPHLRAAAAVTGSRIQASDGDIGHVENLLVDDQDWSIRYLIVDTRNWWPGKHVLIVPGAVTEVSWTHHTMRLDVSERTVRTSPVWDPLVPTDQDYERRLHSHYGWGGYGW